MEATAVSVGKAVLDGALDYAKSKAAEEIALQLGIDGDVSFITDELEMMQSFLMTADEERDQNKVLTTWVKQVRDLAYNVEDSLMDFALQSELEKESSWCIPRNPCHRRRIAKEVKELRAKVEDVSNRNLRYRLIKGSGSMASATGVEQLGIAGAAMFGTDEAWRSATELEKSKLDLHQLITSEEVDLRVIAVWGTSGDLGKTSEIRKAYDDPTVNAKFGCRAWVRLVHPFNPKEFLGSLVRQFYENSPEETGKAQEGRLVHPFNPKEFLGSLVRQFYENSAEKTGKAQEGTTVGANVLLKMEKMGQSDFAHEFNAKVSSNSYLIVINDLSTIEEWDCIKTYFPNKKNQSRIIVSTQQVEIATLCTEQPCQVSELKRLSSDRVLYLFHKKVMPSSDSTEHISDSNTTTTTKNNSAMSTGEIQEEDQQPKDAAVDKVSNSSAGKRFGRSRTMALADEVLTGRETDKSQVIKLIGKPEDEVCKVISVWGMGGLGKTTLVRSVYRSQQLGGWKCAWATALRPFNPEVLIRSLALQLIKDIREDPTGGSGTQKENIAKMALQDLTSQLTCLLETQKCLIVLDDISTPKEWDSVKTYLEKAERIIVTTREKDVAKHCSRDEKNMYSLEGLKEDAPLNLFKKKVFKDNAEKAELRPDMMEQATLILKKCDGLPLAISTIGGFLATKPKTSIEWRKMNDRISAELEINPELKTIKTVLMRSYDGLPYHLKSTFLYLSVFPEDHKIRRNRLVRRWIGEGYSREMHGMTAEEVGGKYFDELFDRSMILPGEGVSHYSEKIDSCQLHDMIREICISKAREENLAFTLEEGCCLSGTRGAIRHLAIGSNWKRDKDVLESMLDLSHVRSLTVFGEWRSFFISDKMRFLRVLDLEDATKLRDHHLDQIGELLHLKYLSLRGCQSIYRLPNSLGNLRQLQTLDVRGTWIFELPITITKLRNLQCLLAGGPFESGKDDVDLFFDRVGDREDLDEPLSCGRCCCALFLRCAEPMRPNLKEQEVDGPKEACKDGCRSLLVYTFRSLLFQSRMCLWRACFLLSMGHLFWRPQLLGDGLNRHDIFNLYRLYTVYEGHDISKFQQRVEVPRGFGKLKALHTLGVVSVARGNRKGEATLKEIKELTQLRKLRVAGVNKKNNKKFWSAIAGHNQLKSLFVRGYSYEELDGGLGGNLMPPECLESLKLYGKLVNATEWIHQLQNLCKLQLEWTRLDQEADVQAIGMLPNLAVLRLMYMSIVREKLHFQGSSFPSLMVLELGSLYGLKSVKFEEHAMPKLELLQANWCHRVEEISGLQFLTSLKEIRLGYGVSAKWKEVQRQLEEDQNRVTDEAS